MAAAHVDLDVPSDKPHPEQRYVQNDEGPFQTTPTSNSWLLHLLLFIFPVLSGAHPSFPRLLAGHCLHLPAGLCNLVFLQHIPGNINNQTSRAERNKSPADANNNGSVRVMLPAGDSVLLNILGSVLHLRR